MDGQLPDSLGQIDPQKAWQPWEPSLTHPWNAKWAAHLFRRAGFGASHTELQEAVKSGLAATLKRVIEGQPSPEDWDSPLRHTGKGTASRLDEELLRNRWVYVLLHTLYPLREKLTLFWHNHFATSIAKVHRTDLMFQQNQLLRRHALGKFSDFLLAMNKDPAMLIWLDSNTNVKGTPNENYARELMELFTLGVGNYTEIDVREAARAFTGWHTDGDEFELDVDSFDATDKTVLGETGRLGGDDVVRIILKQPAVAPFLVRKLYRFFISEADLPPDQVLEPAVQVFRKSDYDIRLLVRTMLSSRLFFSRHAYRQRVKSPVEFVIGIVRACEVSDVSPMILVPELEAMGLALFAPPNVKGWSEGKAWLNTATLLARNSFALRISSGNGTRKPAKAPRMPNPDVAEVLRTEKITEPLQAIDLLLDIYLQGEVGKTMRAKLVAFLADGNPKGDAFYARARQVVTVILSLPEYQLA